MTTIVTRAGKGSALTNSEMDSNTVNLKATADAALAKAGGAMSGAITTNSTFDGRDVATDGTKLDGIEASADVTDTANVTAAGALMDSELTSIASVKALNQGVATGDSPTFAALTSTGEITANGGIALGDGDELTLGDSDEFKIKHHASGYTHLQNTVGTLYIDSDSVTFRDDDGSPSNMVISQTGIDVTGTATMDGLTVNSGGSNVATSFISTDSTVGIKLQDNNGNVELSASGSTFNIQPSGGTSVFSAASNGNVNIPNGGLMIGATTAPFTKSHIKDTAWSSGAPYGTVQLIEGNNVNDDNWGHLLITDTTTSNGNGGSIRFATGASSSLNPFAGVSGVSEGASWGGLGFYTRPQSGSATQRMRIDSSGNVGIANSSLSNWASGYNALQVGGKAFFAAHSSSDSYFGQNAYVNSGWKYASTAAASFIQQSGGQIQFYVAPSGTADSAISWTNALTMDNSGNVLVGTTATDTAAVGFRYRKSLNAISSVADGGISAYFGRRSSDGDIVVFRKDDAIVGSIGTTAGNLWVAGATNGVRLAGGTFNATNASGTVANGAVDLGYSNGKWKDLYLSGGVVFGPASASNVSSQTLDSYEEGTWTPANIAGVSLTVNAAVYTKIGRVVYIGMAVVFASTTNSAAVQFSGLPFAVRNQNDQAYGATIANTDVGRDNIYFAFLRNTTTIGIGNNLNADVANSVYSGKKLCLSGFYFTDE